MFLSPKDNKTMVVTTTKAKMIPISSTLDEKIEKSKELLILQSIKIIENYSYNEHKSKT